MAADSQRIVLSFHDSLIRQQDFNLLDSPGWLNDKLIAFYFEYLERVIFASESDRVCFITPDVAHFIKLYNGRICPSPELGVFLEPLLLTSKELVVVPVNNNQDPSSSGGSHWSLLAYCSSSSSFKHYDSFSSTNLNAARQCAAKLIPFVKVSNDVTQFLESSTPQQTNGHDCGVYTLLFAKTVSEQVLREQSNQSVQDDVTMETVHAFRTELKQLILSLAN